MVHAGSSAGEYCWFMMVDDGELMISDDELVVIMVDAWLVDED